MKEIRKAKGKVAPGAVKASTVVLFKKHCKGENGSKKPIVINEVKKNMYIT
jgi:hypothetical protein